MFESIKLRIIEGRKLLPFATAKVLQDHENRLKALEGPTHDLTVTVCDENNDPIEGVSIVVD